MSQFGGGGAKNPPWVRQGQSMGMGQQNQIQPQMLATQLGNTATAAMLQQYPQAQMFQQSQLGQLQQPGITMQTMGTNQMSSSGGLSAPVQQSGMQQQLYSQVGNVAYPTRSLVAPFANNTGSQSGNLHSGASNASSNVQGTPKQRVFTGTVTKVQDNFGFVDEEVFFQSSCCVKGSNPQVGDRVLVEAMYNSSMPFKWNATRIQVLPMERTDSLHSGSGRGGRFSSSYNSVPPPSNDLPVNREFGRRNRDIGPNKRNRRDEDDFERKRRREADRRSIERIREEREKEKEKEKERERAKSPPPRKRSKSPPRRRKPRVVARYMVQIPKIALDMPEADVLEIKKRYTNLYIPSDFFVSSFKWVEVFPPHRPLTLERPCSFHVMHKEVDPVTENEAVLEPPDADYLFSAKVMLLGMPELNEMYQKCCTLHDGKEGSYDDHNRDFVHPTRLVNFLVGLRGKNETMAIGGPWSPSLDGVNPDKDPTVLIKTAIRSCKALTGIDLSNCSQWYRFVEIYYHRAESVHKGKTLPARVETVVLYLPDVWNCVPTRLEWDDLLLTYKKQLDRLINSDEECETDDKDTDMGEATKKEPSHFSKLDLKVMKVNELRDELEARSLSPKGLKSQLTARLAKALKSEQDKEEENNPTKTEDKEAGNGDSKVEKDEKEEENGKKEEEEKKKLDDKEKQLLEKRYTLPEKPHLLVHPNRVAKSGKFDCTEMSLSLLLDYRPEDSKEHSFEVSLFAELFNEMLMRDFGFCIFKALIEAPEKPKEEKEDKEKNKDKKSDKEKKDDEKKDEKKDKDDKKEKNDRKDDKKEKDDKNSVEEDDGSVEDDDSKKDKKDPDKKKKEKVKLVTVDPYLLLAFVYFDQSHCGYIFDKDIEELMCTLGLNLSRSQIKKLVQKVVSRDSMHYRKLTDKPKDEATNKQNGAQSTDEVSLGLGNKRLFPIFEESSTPTKRNRKGGSETKSDNAGVPDGYVMYNGSLLDVNKLQEQFKRSDDTRIKTEKLLDKLRSENAHLKDTNSRNVATLRKLNSELKDFKERLTNTNSELCSMDSKTKLYFSTMAEVYEKLGHIVKEKQLFMDEVIEDVEMEDVNTNNKKTAHLNIKSEHKIIPQTTNVTGVKDEPKDEIKTELTENKSISQDSKASKTELTENKSISQDSKASVSPVENKSDSSIKEVVLENKQIGQEKPSELKLDSKQQPQCKPAEEQQGKQEQVATEGSNPENKSVGVNKLREPEKEIKQPETVKENESDPIKDIITPEKKELSPVKSTSNKPEDKLTPSRTTRSAKK